MLFATFLLVLTARSSRFTEYWPPFAVLFAAFSLSPLLSNTKSKTETETTEERSRKYYRARHWLGVFAGSIVAFAIIGLLLYNLKIAGTMIQVYSDYSQDPGQYQRGAEWLRTQAPPGETIFNVTWMVFPKLFFYDQSHAYVSGLDPTYLADQDPQLAVIYDRIVSGKERFPARDIRERFGAHYVFIGDRLFHSDLQPFYEIVTTNGEFEKVYEDLECTVLKVR
jgi:hypothetical protein